MSPFSIDPARLFRRWRRKHKNIAKAINRTKIGTRTAAAIVFLSYEEVLEPSPLLEVLVEVGELVSVGLADPEADTVAIPVPETVIDAL
jgi:hypothetical protein